MININLIIRNVRSNLYRSLYYYGNKTFWQHKYWEVQAMLTDNLVCAQFNWTARCDHAGVELELGLLHFNVVFRFYDNRHWDYISESYNMYQDE